MKRTALLLLLFLASVVAFNAQTVEHPDKGSAERRRYSIHQAAGRAAAQAKGRICHQCDQLLGNWVFVDGRLRTPDGKVPNWKNTPYAQAAKYGAQSDGVSAVLRKSGKGWTITTYAIGCTDVCYVDWWKRYKAPKAIFPYTE